MNKIDQSRFQMFLPSTFYRHFISPPQAKNLNITNRSILITGGNNGIGKEACLEMARHKAATVYICARTAATGDEVVRKMLEINPSGDYRFVKLDLGSQSEIKQVVERELNREFDVLIGNAGVWTKDLWHTKDGFESCLGVNHFGHYSFIVHYLNTTKHKPDVITLTASTAHLAAPKGIFFKDPNFLDKSSKYNTQFCYGQSKLANILFTRKLAEKLPETRVNCLHPGVVETNLFDNVFGTSWLAGFLMKVFLRSCKDGAQSILHAAFSEECKVDPAGSYYANCVNSNKYLNQHARSDEQADRLWKLSAELTGLDL